VRLRLALQAREHLGALATALLELRQLLLLLLPDRLQPALLGRELGIELLDAADVLLDGVDLTGACC
jgi:hypothetical protein